MSLRLLPALALAASLGACATSANTTASRDATPAPQADPSPVQQQRAQAEQARVETQCRTFDGIVAQSGPNTFPGADSHTNHDRPQEDYGCEKRRR